METSALTHAGRVRHTNNDGYGAFPELGLFVVVDGMGHRWSGDEGATLVVAALRDAYARGEHSASGLGLAIQEAHRVLREKVTVDPFWLGTGACVAALALVHSTAHVAHVGDCRIHRRAPSPWWKATCSSSQAMECTCPWVNRAWRSWCLRIQIWPSR